MKKFLLNDILQSIVLWIILFYKIYAFHIAIGDPVDWSQQTEADILWYRHDAISWVLITAVARVNSNKASKVPSVILSFCSWTYLAHEYIGTGCAMHPCLEIAIIGFFCIEGIRWLKRKWHNDVR